MTDDDLPVTEILTASADLSANADPGATAAVSAQAAARASGEAAHAPPPVGPEHGTPGWRRTNYLSMMCVFLLTMSFSFTVPFLPLYLQQIDGLDGRQGALWAGVATGLGGVGSFIGGPLWGALGDRFGRKPMLVRASLGGATGLLLLGLSTSTWQVVVIRGLIGFMAGAPAAAMALIAAGTPRSLLARSLGQAQAALLAGLALGPVFAALLVGHFGYRNTFVLAGILMYSGSIVSALFIREQRVPWVRAEHRSGALAVLLRQPVVWSALILMLVVSYAAPMVQPILPAFVVALLPRGASVNGTVGLLFFGISASSAIAAILAGRFIRRIGLQRILLVSFLGIAAFLIAAGRSTTVGQLAVLIIGMSFFQGALQTTSVALLPEVVSASAVSSIFGLYQSVSTLSAQMGPAIGGGLAVSFGFRAVFPIDGGALLALGIPAFYVFHRLTRARPPSQASA
jgi:DHA1 family multidrug resistance protein-like MFS transporter